MEQRERERKSERSNKKNKERERERETERQSNKGREGGNMDVDDVRNKCERKDEKRINK